MSGLGRSRRLYGYAAEFADPGGDGIVEERKGEGDGGTLNSGVGDEAADRGRSPIGKSFFELSDIAMRRLSLGRRSI